MADDNDDRFKALFEGKPGTLLGAEREKLVKVKEEWAREGRVPHAGKEAAAGTAKPEAWRLPPGQRWAKDWPVLDLGTRPAMPTDQWQLTVAGAVENRIRWSWDDFMAQPQTEFRIDYHCVTGWSRKDDRWTGVATRHFLDVVKPQPAARFVMLHSHDGYTTNVPLAFFAAEDSMLARAWNGQPLAREHGGPVRAFIPKLYLWKSAKWLRHVVFLDKDQPGFWEARGYHDVGDPWKEERYR